MYILSLYLSISLSVSLPLLWDFGLYSDHGLPNFLPPILFCATNFQFQICSRETVSFSTLSSHLLCRLPTSFFLRRFILKSYLTCDCLPSLYFLSCTAPHCVLFSTLLVNGWMQTATLTLIEWNECPSLSSIPIITSLLVPYVISFISVTSL